MVLVPEKANIEADALKGSETPRVILKMESNIPSGNHMNMMNEDIRVGLKANLPSWKINGLGYHFLGSSLQFLLSLEVNIKQTFCQIEKKTKLKI